MIFKHTLSMACVYLWTCMNIQFVNTASKVDVCCRKSYKCTLYVCMKYVFGNLTSLSQRTSFPFILPQMMKWMIYQRKCSKGCRQKQKCIFGRKGEGLSSYFQVLFQKEQSRSSSDNNINCILFFCWRNITPVNYFSVKIWPMFWIFFLIDTWIWFDR